MSTSSPLEGRKLDAIEIAGRSPKDPLRFGPLCEAVPVTKFVLIFSSWSS